MEEKDYKLMALKLRIRTVISKAIKKGEITKPDFCPQCGKYVGNPARMHAHHLSWEPEDIFIITWLCQSCHVTLHNEERSKMETRWFIEYVNLNLKDNGG
jgi:hypothetical protein